MKDVQLENGYTRIANEILEQLATIKLNGTQLRIMLIIFRYTYGFQRKEHELSLSFLSNAINCDKRQLQRELKKLEKLNIINQNIKSGSYRKISFNKNYDLWNIGKTTIGENAIGENTIATIGENIDATIGENTKQEKKKEKFKKSANADTQEELFLKFWQLYPNKKGKSAVNKKSKEAIYKVGIEKMTQAIENYKQELKREAWKQPMNGSTFFNGRYEDYLQDNFHEETTPKDQSTGNNLKEFLMKREVMSN